jgi:hypothetical protein
MRFTMRSTLEIDLGAPAPTALIHKNCARSS